MAPDWRDQAGKMRRAAVEGRAAQRKLEELLAATERELVIERRHLEDVQRRGTQAQAIGDAETAEIAGRFSARHAERVTVLEQKVASQRAELALVVRDVQEMVDQVKDLERRAGRPVEDPAPAVPDLDADAAAGLGADLDRAARESAAEERLRELKKRMGK